MKTIEKSFMLKRYVFNPASFLQQPFLSLSTSYTCRDIVAKICVEKRNAGRIMQPFTSILYFTNFSTQVPWVIL